MVSAFKSRDAQTQWDHLLFLRGVGKTHVPDPYTEYTYVRMDADRAQHFGYLL